MKTTPYTTHVGSLTSYVAVCGHIWNYDCVLMDIAQYDESKLDCEKCREILISTKKREAEVEVL